MATRKKFDKGNRLKERMETINAHDKERVLSSSNKIHHIVINKIKDNPYQPRINIDQNELEELKSSIEQNGLIQPITVSKTNDGYFIVVAGHRRLEAYKQLQKETIEAIITTKSDEELKILVLLENLQRKDLDPLELALTYQKLLDTKQISQKDLAKLISKSQSHISRIIKLLNLADDIQQEIKNKTYTNIKVLNQLNKVEQKKQKEVLDEVRHLSTDDAIKHIKNLLKGEKSKPKTFEFKSNKEENHFTIKLDFKSMNDSDKKEAIKRLQEVIERLRT